MMAQMDADSDKIALENKQGTCFYNFVMCWHISKHIVRLFHNKFMFVVIAFFTHNKSGTIKNIKAAANKRFINAIKGKCNT